MVKQTMNTDVKLLQMIETFRKDVESAIRLKMMLGQDLADISVAMESTLEHWEWAKKQILPLPSVCVPVDPLINRFVRSPQQRCIADA